MKKVIIIALLFYFNINAQTDRHKWQPVNKVYQLKQDNGRDYSLDKHSAGSFLLTGIRDIYWLTFSDLDGDNCPFHPTCSTFFVKSVKKTNIVQGALMFADRFTRDSNLFKGKDHYKRDETGKLYDPVNNYTLNEKQIIYIETGSKGKSVHEVK
ncbi:hypothetical protein BMS3Abin04_00837 [bacterium BMS3Abin04]|nr:hypothetical protein BMS3Abin04_00837 [bacterium BMS3Abin04]